MTKTLVVGGRSGIGETIVSEMLGREPFGEIFVPSPGVLDVRSPSEFFRYFSDHGPFDFIVYSAGVNHLMPIGWIDRARMAETFAVNVQGFINLLDTVVKFRKPGKKQLDGRHPEWEPCDVVAIVSDSATTPMRHSIAYASSKAALAHAIRCAARELAPWCRVNGVSPSIVDDTPMTTAVDKAVLYQRGWTEQEAHEYEMSLVPMGRRALKLEVARVVLSVLEGPEFMTGAVIPITGGK